MKSINKSWFCGNLFLCANSLPYRFVFAIATEDSVYIYDTQNLKPFAYATGLHYSNLSDLSWSRDGRVLIVTSIDGFCTFVMFGENELGTIYDEQTPLGMPAEQQPESTTQSASTASESVIEMGEVPQGEAKPAPLKVDLIRSMFQQLNGSTTADKMTLVTVEDNFPLVGGSTKVAVAEKDASKSEKPEVKRIKLVPL